MSLIAHLFSSPGEREQGLSTLLFRRGGTDRVRIPPLSLLTSSPLRERGRKGPPLPCFQERRCRESNSPTSLAAHNFSSFGEREEGLSTPFSSGAEALRELSFLPLPRCSPLLFRRGGTERGASPPPSRFSPLFLSKREGGRALHTPLQERKY